MRVRLLIVASLALLVPRTAPADGARYLIITPPEFADEIEPLADWKTLKGLLARVVDTDETGYSAIEIRNYIVEAAETWDPAPEYVLLVGGMGELPMPWVEDGYSDTYYGNVDEDMFVELHVGRFPATTELEVDLMVDKTLQYERTPSLADPDYYTSAVLLIYEDWDDDDWLHYYGDLNWATGLMQAAGMHDVQQITYGTTPSPASTFQGTLEAGVAYAGHHGVIGGHTGCDWPGYSLFPATVDNGPMLPVIVSYTCQTMAYSGSYDCGGELWMKAGSPGDLRGGVAFVGQSVSCSYCAHWRSSLRRGFWGHIFEDTGPTDRCTFGEAVEAGRLHYYDEFHLSSQYYASNLYGDPELNLWTGVPQEWTLSFPPTVPRGDTAFEVVARVDGEPLPGALICASSSSDAYAWATTDDTGRATLTLDTSAVDDLVVTGTGRNLMPFSGVIGVGTGEPVVSDDDDDTDDDTDDPANEPDDTVTIGGGDCACNTSSPAGPGMLVLLLAALAAGRHLERRRDP